MSLRLAVAAITTAALLSGCAGATTQPSPTTPPAKPAAAASPTPTALVAAAPASSPVAQPSPVVSPVAAASPAAASPAYGASPVAAPPGSAAPVASTAAGTRLTVVTEQSQARFRAREQLAGRNLPNEAVGATPAVSGTISLGPNGAIVPDRSKVVVDLRQLRSDESRRDNWIQRNTLQTDQFPDAELVPREATGLPNPLPRSGEATFKLLSDLTVHGVTRPVSWDVTAHFEEGHVAGSASTRVKMTDFGMTPPRVGPVLSIDDELTLEVDFRATRENV
jgi:polyisoprenoid-binding protein YceI